MISMARHTDVDGLSPCALDGNGGVGDSTNLAVKTQLSVKPFTGVDVSDTGW